MVPKIPAVKLERLKKMSVFILKRMFFSILQFWQLWVPRRYVPHFKGLISAKVELEAQGHDSTFTICLAFLKMISLYEFSIIQLWQLVFLEPVGVQGHTVPHFKGLILLYLDSEAQERDTTFTFCHTLLKTVILLLKKAYRPKLWG